MVEAVVSAAFVWSRKTEVLDVLRGDKECGNVCPAGEGDCLT